MRKPVVVALALLAVFVAIGVVDVLGQGAPAPVPAAAAPATPAPAAGGDASGGVPSFGLFSVIMSSGALGVILWLALFGDFFAEIWFMVDCGIYVRASKIMPQTLVDKVTEAMAQGDVLKALQECENEPGPMANILTAGFSHVEEGYEIIQEAVSMAADMENEKLMQRISYISITSSIGPMLGLLGTVQGMIWAFASLAQTGVAVISILAANIGQALYTTAAGLCVAIPGVLAFALYRNKANRIILRMEMITMELIKDLRNVEVVKE